MDCVATDPSADRPDAESLHHRPTSEKKKKKKSKKKKKQKRNAETRAMVTSTPGIACAVLPAHELNLHLTSQGNYSCHLAKCHQPTIYRTAGALAQYV
ncbi:hypothetical protein VTJ83DRAFT_4466 [Remersonia thermophila]|uniref:Uncharacterized protein n=1 Tax=Remersonia thermophila TaxID=72144 RepID=A0ABR4D9Z5_9PEZI